jgi:Ni/Co efflux regulator RcnB
MKSTAIACAIAAGALGFGSLSWAQGYEGRGDRDERRGHSQRADRGDRHDRVEKRGDRHDRVEQRGERRDNRREWRAGQHDQRGYGRQNQYVQQPRQQYRPYDAYRHDGQRGQWASPPHRYQRGDYLPYQLRQRHYYVNDWRSHHQLYAPPHGYHWVQADGGDYLLVAIATGLIANLLLNQ